MNNIEKRKFWQFPWGFRESIAIVCGILIVGMMLQLTVHKFNFYLLAAPVNIIVGAITILLCGLSVFAPKSAFFKWFSGIPFSVTLILALLCLTLIMGLTPQTTAENANIFSVLGFTDMTSSWPFVLVYYITLLSLGCLIVRKLTHFQRKDYAFYLFHFGIWLTLFAAGLGNADIERYVMHVREGETEWRVFDDNGQVKELPIAIQLNDFDMEEYPPKLTIIDRESGMPQPEDKPDFYQIDTKSPRGKLYNWDIVLEEYVHQAVRNSDSTYRAVPMPGATPAARILAKERTTGEEHRGWVCGGNQAQMRMTLPVSNEYSVVMTIAEPKRYMSDIEVYTPHSGTKSAIIEVNKPLRIGHWTIYQYGYDNQAGRLSSYSSMELVYDPWLIPVYIGFILIAIGAIAMLCKGAKVQSANSKKK